TRIECASLFVLITSFSLFGSKITLQESTTRLAVYQGGLILENVVKVLFRFIGRCEPILHIQFCFFVDVISTKKCIQGLVGVCPGFLTLCSGLFRQEFELITEVGVGFVSHLLGIGNIAFVGVSLT